MKLKKLAKGGQNKPIITNDPKDKRLKAYNDSLSNYNWGENRRQSIINANPGLDWQRYNNDDSDPVYRGVGNQYPNGVITWRDSALDPKDNKKYFPLSIAQFTQPVQPIIYQPKRTEQPIQIDNIIPTLNTYQPENNLVESPKNYFTRPRQSQEAGQGKTDMFDKKTGKLMGTYADGGGVNKLEGDLYSKVLLNRNRDKEFVNRAYVMGQYPNQFGSETVDFDSQATHLMGWGEDESGQAYMSPTIFNPNNDAVKVPNQYADYISSEGYKNETGLGQEKKEDGGFYERKSKSGRIFKYKKYIN